MYGLGELQMNCLLDKMKLSESECEKNKTKPDFAQKQNSDCDLNTSQEFLCVLKPVNVPEN